MLEEFFLRQAKYTTKKILCLFFLVYLIFPLYLLPQILPEGQPLDLQLYYTPMQAYKLIASYGVENRLAYIKGLITIDMVYPLFYSLFLSLLLTFFIARSYAKNHKMQYVRVLPFFIMLVDIIENICIILMLLEFPCVIESLALVSGLMTLLKWLLIVMIFVILCYAVVHFYLHRSDIEASENNAC
ncbi:hypothetical protein H4J59_10840 [Colwellia sp. MB02u-10]|uniref:hypothetical protein n=1 Tax=Colwellia sp. MB02u-10 TaxID=2759828 RepID=UPI0015F3CC7F|nr:hypothetical protein [Colwellia sp. MB02u-10]MBA6341482.1 hypothetical protein [Colwellia sp. MB02u-10]